MSISNSFALPVKVVATDASLGHYRVDDSFGMVVAALMKKDEAEAIKLALDSHESLVSANKELSDALASVKADLLERADTDSGGMKVVNCGNSVWIKINRALAKHSQESK